MLIDRRLVTRWAIVAIVVALAAEARLLGLDLRSLWFDEAFSVTMARLPAVWRFLPNNDVHPPLYYVLLRGWVHLFGSSEIAVRSLSALAGVAMVPLLYAFARQMVEDEVALAAAALLAGSAFATVAAQEARMYPLLGLLALLSWLSLRSGIRHPRIWPWAAYVSSSALMLYTHYFGFLVLASQVLYLLPLARRDRRTFVLAALAMGVTVVLFLPWLPAFVRQATSGRGWPTFRLPVGPGVVADLLAQFAFGGELLGTGGYHHGGVLPLWQGALVVLPVVALVGAGLHALRGERTWCLFCYWVVPPALALALSLRTNVFYARYFSFLAPAFALLAASGLAAMAGPLSRVARARSEVLVALVTIVLAANLPVVNGYRWRHAGDYDWRGAAAVVSKKAGPHDYLLFVPGFARIPFEYYYKGSLGRYELTPVEIYTAARMKGPPTPKVDPAWLRSLAEAHPRVWIVATVPVTPTSYQRLGDLLGDNFTPGTGWDFNNVYVFPLTSRLYGRSARSP